MHYAFNTSLCQNAERCTASTILTIFRFFGDNNIRVHIGMYDVAISAAPNCPLYTHQTVLLHNTCDLVSNVIKSKYCNIIY